MKWIHRFRPVYLGAIARSPTLDLAIRFMGGLTFRDVNSVREGYEKVWAAYEDRLDRAGSLEEWLYIPGHDDVRRGYRIDGKLKYQSADFVKFVVEQAVNSIKCEFPVARSITEYGSGYGRILLGIKSALPHLDCYGYELAASGVAVSNRAAKKFGLDVKFERLDYVNDPESSFVHPESDLAVTSYSLEQVPNENQKAIKNMLAFSKLGSIHIEPVSENYPWSYEGVLGRLYSFQANYLRKFDRNVRELGLADVQVKMLNMSHNPLIFPSLYILRK